MSTKHTQKRAETVAKEDLILFVNACFACTGQREFYGLRAEQRVSIEFLHQYILGNYRRLYAQTLAAGINHFNQGMIVFHLLAAGSPASVEDRDEESFLLRETLRALPANRVYRLFRKLRNQRVNNRRTRAVIREYLEWRKDIAFDAVKYRGAMRACSAHIHWKAPGEVGDFLFYGWKSKVFRTELFEDYRQAHYAEEAIYKLPYTVAEGLARRKKIPNERFLKKIASQMTVMESLRHQRKAESAKLDLSARLEKSPLTPLASYLISIPENERRERSKELRAALERSAWRCLSRANSKLGKVVAILDRSHSTVGSFEKRGRPLAIALAVDELLRQGAEEYTAIWTPHWPEDSLFLRPSGQTDIASPLLDALRLEPELIIIVSDGFENDPPGLAHQLLRKYQGSFGEEHTPTVIHLNPVFDSENYAPKSFGPSIATVGIRQAEDLFTMLGFARFAQGECRLSDLEDYLQSRIEKLVASQPFTQSPQTQSYSNG